MAGVGVEGACACVGSFGVSRGLFSLNVLRGRHSAHGCSPGGEPRAPLVPGGGTARAEPTSRTPWAQRRCGGTKPRAGPGTGGRASALPAASFWEPEVSRGARGEGSPSLPRSANQTGLCGSWRQGTRFQCTCPESPRAGRATAPRCVNLRDSAATFGSFWVRTLWESGGLAQACPETRPRAAAPAQIQPESLGFSASARVWPPPPPPPVRTLPQRARAMSLEALAVRPIYVAGWCLSWGHPRAAPAVRFTGISPEPQRGRTSAPG